VNHPSLQQFLAACGSDGPIRVGVGQGDEVSAENWTFQQPFLVIGRRPESDLAIDHWQVSRRHAYLQLIEGRYYCVDLGSRTGTHGGDASERSGWLERGRAIQIGPFAVRPEWPTPADPGARSLPGVTWQLPGRALGQAVWRMDRHLVLVGRSPACKIRIVEPDVSKFHCSLVLTPMGVWVVDLLGQKGVYVNGEPVRSAWLRDGDDVRVGRHLLRPRYDYPPPSPMPSPSPSIATSAPAPAPAQEHRGLAPYVPPPMTTPGDDLPARIPSAVPGAWSPQGPLIGVSPGVPIPGVDPTVSLLVHQFGMMQQQMFDQFHNTMMMMFEGFAALHREQSATLREEFERVRQLSQEIEALRAQTAKLAESIRPPGRPASPANGHREPATPPGPRLGLAGATPDPARRPIPPPAPPDRGGEVDVHARLCSRLASIEAERQNRWQKILGMMTSRS